MATSDEAPDVDVNAPKPSARKLLVDWANGEDGWARELVSEVLASRQELSDEAIEAVFDRYLAEKGLSDAASEAVPTLELDERSGAEAATLVIEKLDAVAGVNALAAEQLIEFNPGMTVLFGENGSGKTGYTRIFKHLAAVRTAEDILPNVHDQNDGTTPEATIAFSVGGSTTKLEWRGERGVAPFTHVGIFDTPAVHLHVDDDLTYLYTPSDLALFPLVNKGISAVKDRLDRAVQDRRPSGNPFVSHFTRGTPVYQVIETLGAATDLAQLKQLADVDASASAQLESLNQRVQALQSSALTAQLSVARTRRDFYEILGAAVEAAQRFNADTYNQATVSASEAEADVIRLRTELFAVAGLSGDGDAIWQQFIIGGEEYREHLAAHEYPKKGDRCLYCQQPLEAKALALVRRYRDFANDSAQQRVKDARVAAELSSRDLLAVRCDQLASAATQQPADDNDKPDDVLSRSVKLIETVELTQAAIHEGRPVDGTALETAAAGLDEEARTRREAAEALIADLSAKADERRKTLDEAQTERDRLKDRIELNTRHPAVTAHVEQAKWAQKAEQLARRIPPVLRSLTETAKTASDQLLNSDFAERFAVESKALRAPSVSLEFPGRQGKAARRKTVSANHRPSAILSEGEQKVIALADFLAESALRLTPAPLIFDDPVNSLDYRRLREVADRIAGLAAGRQVIVFTHNIWFAAELLSRFEKTPDRCRYYSITDETAKGVGVVAAGTHPRWDTVKKTTGRINALINTARSSDGEARQALVESAYGVIRAWCEVVVEDELLAGVTKRYQPNVGMTKLPQIKAAHLGAAITVIVPIFENACRIMEGHSQPLETLAVRPSLDDLERAWKALQEARTAYREA
ncbi:MAG: AAA family ATPase [Solirubrobacteraceae bacterium]